MQKQQLTTIAPKEPFIAIDISFYSLLVFNVCCAIRWQLVCLFDMAVCCCMLTRIILRNLKEILRNFQICLNFAILLKIFAEI